MIYKIIFMKPFWTASSAMEWITSVNERFKEYEDNAYFHTFIINYGSNINTRNLVILPYDENTFIIASD